MNHHTKESVQNDLEAAGFITYDRGANDVGVLCPFCPESDPDMKGKCYVTPEHPKYGAIFHCFRCETAGGIKTLYQKLGMKVRGTTASMGQLEDRIFKAERQKKFREQEYPQTLRPISLPEEYQLLSKTLVMNSTLAMRALRWLENRGLSWRQIRDWQIGYCANGDLAQHLVLPVFDKTGAIVSYQARRFIGSIDPKSRNPYVSKTDVGREDILYGVHKARKGNCLVLVEGPFDVHALERVFLRFHLAHFTPLGVFGHKLSRTQALEVAALEPSATWTMMDADAVKESFKMAQMLSPKMEGPVYVAALENGDPDDLTPIQAIKKLKKSPRVVSFPGSIERAFRGPTTKSERAAGEGSV